MSEGFSNAVIGGAETLARTGMKSLNFIASVQGWRLDRDGNAELNDLIIRGSINIATGVVVINNVGIEVTGPTEKFTINVTGGIRARKVPDDGSFITVNSDGIFIHEKEPSPLLGLNSNSAVMQTDNISGGGTEWVRMKIFSPEWDTQLGTSSISLWSRASNGAGTVIDFNASNVIRNNVGRVEFNDEVVVRQTDGDPMFEQFHGNAVRATDLNIPSTSPGIVLFTYTGAVWKANTAYRVKVKSRYIGLAGTPGTQPLMVLRRGTTTAGSLLVDNGRLDYTAASSNFKIWECVFIVGAVDVTSDICITAGSVIGGAGTVVVQQGAGDNPSLMEVFEIGPASRYAGFNAI